MKRDECEHGSLRRKCQVCALTAQVELLRVQLMMIHEDHKERAEGLAADILKLKNELKASKLARGRYRSALEEIVKGIERVDGDPFTDWVHATARLALEGGDKP